jgi:hypothetical protein
MNKLFTLYESERATFSSIADAKRFIENFNSLSYKLEPFEIKRPSLKYRSRQECGWYWIQATRHFEHKDHICFVAK